MIHNVPKLNEIGIKRWLKRVECDADIAFCHLMGFFGQIYEKLLILSISDSDESKIFGKTQKSKVYK